MNYHSFRFKVQVQDANDCESFLSLEMLITSTKLQFGFDKISGENKKKVKFR